MPAKHRQQKINGAALLKKLTVGFETKPTRRGGKDGFVLVRHDGRTLAMASIKNTGAVRLEGNRLDKNMTIIDAAGVAKGRKAIEAVNKENLAKLAERENRKTAMTAKRVAATKAKQGGGSGETSKPSGRRARSRMPVRGETVA